MATYTVKKGDTLSGIGQRFGVTVEALVASNGIKNKNVIREGQRLTIPEKKPSKDYAAIGKKVDEVLADISALPSFIELCKMI